MPSGNFEFTTTQGFLLYVNAKCGQSWDKGQPSVGINASWESEDVEVIEAILFDEDDNELPVKAEEYITEEMFSQIREGLEQKLWG